MPDIPSKDLPDVASAYPPEHLHVLIRPYRSPDTCISAFMQADYAAGFLSDGGALGRWTWLCGDVSPTGTLAFDDPRNPAPLLRETIGGVLRDTVISGDMQTPLPPFTGGLIGMAAFELGLRLEDLPRRPFHLASDRPWPELTLMRIDSLAAFDLHQQQLILLGRGGTPDEARDRAVALAARLDNLPPDPPSPKPDAPLLSETPDDVFEARVAQLVTRIHAGELFQANLSRGWRAQLPEDVTPAHLLKALLRTGPSPFGAFLRWEDRIIVSNSPERFISLSNDGHLETRPIKGTRPRGRTAQDDAALAAELLASPKDRAENLMIVDLMRHDLSKVAQIGSVRVQSLHALESYPNVHHLVSTVTARLRENLTPADVMLATFPPGSISGAPKVQAMKVINDLEDTARGPYCGSLFWVDPSGAMDSSVLIRTAACEPDAEGLWSLRICAGGGIVADSDPGDERRETETKLSLFRAVLNTKR
ncbi:MAG: chorismate-binding protein [Asticcacaulis sp.]